MTDHNSTVKLYRFGGSSTGPQTGAVHVIDHADSAENLSEVLSWAKSSKNQGKCIIVTNRDLPDDNAISYLDIYLDYSESPIITRRQPVDSIGK